MRILLLLSILFCLVGFPVLAETPNNDIKTDIADIKTDIAVIQSEIKNPNDKINDRFNNINNRFDGIEKNFDRLNNVIIACIAIPMAIIAILIRWRSLRDSTQSKEIAYLREEIETLKQQRIVNP